MLKKVFQGFLIALILVIQTSCLDQNHVDQLSESKECPHCKLSRANLRYVTLKEANLSRANLVKASLINANLSGADLSDADMRGTNLKGAKLNNTSLKGARLVNPGINETLFCNTIMPDGKLNNSNC